MSKDKDGFAVPKAVFKKSRAAKKTKFSEATVQPVRDSDFEDELHIPVNQSTMMDEEEGAFNLGKS